MTKVSVVIPIYMVEKYIERCARSLFEQTLDDIEYLFINDCTPDSSMNILARVIEDYPKRKFQTRILEMPTNGGLAAVRRHFQNWQRVILLYNVIVMIGLMLICTRRCIQRLFRPRRILWYVI